MSTSTAYNVYRDLCERICHDSKLFQTFKSHPDYVQILEHVNYQQGVEYLDVIKHLSPQLLELVDRFRTNDSIGGPTTHVYPEIGRFSPTSLRYIKIAGDILRLFKTWENAHIFELGAGYGGQCKILNDISRFKHYDVFDFPETIPLIRRVLNELGVSNVNFYTEESLREVSCDFFISNYAFSELPRTLQQKILDRVISKACHGYMICNNVNDILGIDAYSQTELLDRIPHPCTIVPEIPQTHPTNFLLYW